MSFPCQKSTEALSCDLNGSLRDLKTKLKRVLRLVRQLEQHADFVAAVSQGRPVQIRQQSLLPSQPRQRGRPPGAQNGVVLFASPSEVARLRSELQP